MRKIVLIGKNSYLAAGLPNYMQSFNISYMSHGDWKERIDEILDAKAVINFCISPNFSSSIMKPDDVIDVQIAKRILNRGIQYIFLSSRKVYGSSDECRIYKETDSPCGVDFYAKNKIMTENVLQDLLNDNLTICRLSNIIGEPIVRQGYKTFVGWICENFLLKGKLVVTQNTNAKKDFITKEFLHQALAHIIKQKTKGIINISSGFGSFVKDILDGYIGGENVEYLGNDLPCKDQFILNNDKLRDILHYTMTPTQLTQYLQKCKSQIYAIRQYQYILKNKFIIDNNK